MLSKRWLYVLLVLLWLLSNCVSYFDFRDRSKVSSNFLLLVSFFINRGDFFIWRIICFWASVTEFCSPDYDVSVILCIGIDDGGSTKQFLYLFLLFTSFCLTFFIVGDVSRFLLCLSLVASLMVGWKPQTDDILVLRVWRGLESCVSGLVLRLVTPSFVCLFCFFYYLTGVIDLESL